MHFFIVRFTVKHCSMLKKKNVHFIVSLGSLAFVDQVFNIDKANLHVNNNFSVCIQIRTIVFWHLFLPTDLLGGHTFSSMYTL